MEKSLKKPLISGSFKMLGSHIYFAICSYATLAILSRSLGVESFGLYTLLISLLFWVELVTAEAFRPPLVNAMAKQDGEVVKRLLAKQAIFIFCLIFIFVVFRDQIASLFRGPELANYLPLLALDLLPYSLYFSCMALLNALDRYTPHFVVSIIYSTGKLVFMAGGALLFEDVSYVIPGMALASLFAAFAAVLFTLSAVKASKSETAVEVKKQAKEISRPYLFCFIQDQKKASPVATHLSPVVPFKYVLLLCLQS